MTVSSGSNGNDFGSSVSGGEFSMTSSGSGMNTGMTTSGMTTSGMTTTGMTTGMTMGETSTVVGQSEAVSS